MTIKNIIFDGDDTLWPCGVFYNKQKVDFSEWQAVRLELPVDVCLKVLNDIDAAAIALPDAFNKERYPRSFRAASYALDILANQSPNSYAANLSHDIGQQVFNYKYKIFNGVRELLETLTLKYKLFLYTKGDINIQQKKITDNNLLTFFPPHQIYIVPTKNGTYVKKLLEDHNIEPHETILVGDSVRDDIRSANESKIESILIDNPNKPIWSYETTNDTPTHVVEHVTHILTILSAL